MRDQMDPMKVIVKKKHVIPSRKLAKNGYTGENEDRPGP